jgi:ribonuclease-3
MSLALDQGRIESPAEFNERLGLGFSNIALLSRALTHRSYINENSDALEDNERLEFLGDAVLDFVAEGDLTLVRTALVRTEQLAEFALLIQLGEALRLGQGEILSGGRSRKALLCAGFEALIGSVYLDRGINAVEKFITPFLTEAISTILEDDELRDPKSLLQEWTQARGHPAPIYQTVKESGPDHDKEFEVQVSVPGVITGLGRGSNKREASKMAARQALNKLSPQGNGQQDD